MQEVVGLYIGDARYYMNRSRRLEAMSFPSCRGSAFVTAEVRGLRPFVSSQLPLAVPNEIKVDGKAVKCGDYKFVQGKASFKLGKNAKYTHYDNR